MSSLRVTEYQIGWICALSHELAASRAMIDEEHGMPDVQEPDDHNTYYAGRMHDHNIIMACLPAGRDGAAAAATVAKDMIRTFPKLRFCLLVGIGGGVPDIPQGRDIRLGDIVVSMPTSGHGGVIQYDKGKATENGFIRKGALNSPPTVLLTAVSSLQAENDLRGSQVPTYISMALDKYPRLKDSGYETPGTEYDLLFKSSYVHQSGNQSCLNCNKAHLVARPARNNHKPRVHYGLIASADRVVKTSSLRDQLARHDGAMCVEMEAAGLMNSLPCLVIRGICDYADSHKNDDWHKYAALAAAGYGKELLTHVSVSKLTKENTINDLMDIVKRQIQVSEEHMNVSKKYFSAHFAAREKDDFTKCHQAFKTCDYLAMKNFNPKAMEGTCQWVTKNDKYLRWQTNQASQLLWVTADPGCGKSVLAKKIIDEALSENGNVSICYFFFKDNEEQSALSTALCAVLHQLFATQPHLLRHALESWKKNGAKISDDLDELWLILVSAAADTQASPIICVFDALDECREHGRKTLIQFLRTYVNVRSPSQRKKLKFFVTSRPYEDIEYVFAQNGAIFDQIRVFGESENEQLQKEIDLTVQMRVAELRDEFRLSKVAENKLRSDLFSMEHRTYLWLHLAFETVRQTYRDSMQPDLVVIPRLPTSVEDAYEQILNRIDPDQHARVRKILLIVLGARWSLTVGEMALALTCATDSSVTPSADISVEHVEKYIRHWCGLFIYLNKSKLQLIHQTAKEFLVNDDLDSRIHSQRKWKSCMNPAEIEYEMAQICTTYLCHAPLKPCIPHLYTVAQSNGYSLSIAHDLQTRANAIRPRIPSSPLDENPDLGTFFEYASNFWAIHLGVDKIDKIDMMLVKVLMLFRDDVQRWECFYKTMMKEVVGWRRNGEYPGGSPIHLAAFLGQVQLLQAIAANENISIDEFDGYRRTPLMWAASKGRYEMVKWLTDRKADVNKASEQDYENVLDLALQSDSEATVRYLLDHGADINANYKLKDDSPLTSMARQGFPNMLRIVLETGPDIDESSGFWCDTALQAAAANGHTECVRLLLEAGANVNLCNALESHDAAREEKYNTALQLAALNGTTDTVKLLLDHGAMLHAGIPELCCSAVHAAAQGAHPEVVQLLIEAGADIHIQDSCEGNAIQHAVKLASPYEHETQQHRREATLKVLLDNGANLDSGYGVHANVLQSAAAKGSVTMVNFLLDLGSHLFADAQTKGFALHAAAYESRLDNIEILLAAGADINTTGGHYGNALCAAIMGDPLMRDPTDPWRSIKTVNLLLTRGIDANLFDDRWRTPLHYAAYVDSDEVVSLLLRHEADLNIIQVGLGTPLHASVWEDGAGRRRIPTSGVNMVVKLLIEAGANVNADADTIGPPLIVAARSGFRQDVRFLLQHGANVNATSEQYGNAMMAAIKSTPRLAQDRDAIVQLLLEYGFNVSRQGRPARKEARKLGYQTIVDLLDESLSHAS